MLGNGGNHLLIGGSDADVLTGDAGADVFVVIFADANDRITDFGLGQGDLVLIAMAEVLTPDGLVNGSRPNWDTRDAGAWPLR